MKIDTDKFKTQAKKEFEKIVDSAQKQSDNFQKKYLPIIKKNLKEGVEKANKATKGQGKVIFEKSKKLFKDSVRALDQKVNGSSVHRDNKEEK